MVPEEGVEPTRPCDQRILSPPRLPFRHSGVQMILGYLASHGNPGNANLPIGALHRQDRDVRVNRRPHFLRY